MKELKRYFSYIGKYQFGYWAVFLMTLTTSAILTLVYPYMNKLIFNAMEYRDWGKFQGAVVLCAVLAVLNCLAPYRRYFQIKIVRNIVFDIKIRLFEKLTKMNMNYFEKHHSGEALKILNWDANSLKDSYFSHVFWVAGRLVNGVTSVVAMFVYSPVLMAVSVSFCLITVFFSVKINQQIKKLDKEIQNKLSCLTAWLSDILSGFTILKMYPGARIIYDNFYQENKNVFEQENQRAKDMAGLEMVAFLLGILGSFGTVGVGAYLVSCNRLDYGTVMAIVSLQMNVSFMVQSFGSALATFSGSLVKAGRVFDFLEMDGEEAEEEVVLTRPQGEVVPLEVQNITFSYDGVRNVLENYSLRLEKGEKFMLTGASGCGKSTLLKLLVGFCKTKGGTIRLFGKDLEDYSLSELHRLITYVPQRSYLFEGTIRENIASGAGEATVSEAAMMHAAQMAHADEFILALPQGYDTFLEAGGSNLSVGQRQRIALARAFVKEAPILLMDEPTSALDAHSEQMIYQSVREQQKEKTVIWVTHRKRNCFE